MMNIQPSTSRWLLCVAAVLLLCIGILIGTGFSGKEPSGESVVAAFAPVASLESDEYTLTGNETDAAQDGSPTVSSIAGTPAPTLDNWFAIDLVPSAGSTASPNGSAPSGSLPTGEAVAVPSPSPTQEADFRIELVRDGEEGELITQLPIKRVLIYHTHTYEAFQQTEANPYRETQQWRTQDEKYNIVRVGEELASLLRSMGIQVVHDTTAFEPPLIDSSYTRSLTMLEKRKSMGETFDLYLDVHRDAYVASQPGPNAVSVGDGSVARLMMLVGKGEGQTAMGYDEKPQWQDNLQIAQRLTDGLNSQVPGLGKEVRIKSGRFNQHIAVGCLVVEVGNNQNTLEEALAAMPYLADAVYQELRREKE